MNSSEIACIGVYEDFSFEEVQSMAPSIQLAWGTGETLEWKRRFKLFVLEGGYDKIKTCKRGVYRSRIQGTGKICRRNRQGFSC